MLNGFIDTLYNKTIGSAKKAPLTEQELEVLNKMEIHREELRHRPYKPSNPQYVLPIADQIAKENNIEYKYSLTYGFGGAVHRTLCEGRYLAFSPAINGLNTGMYYRWEVEKDGDSFWVINNEKAFKNITNLSEILLQMVNLYEKYLNQNIAILPFHFALKLEDPITPHYKGTASLVITEGTIEKTIDADYAKECLNMFLDCFMSWNFGVCIRNNPELEDALLKLNKKAIKMGLRKYAGPPLHIWQTEFVQQYPLRSE